jgi:large subunit ribosomal protein L29
VKASEVHNLKDDELVERIRQTREEQFNLRLQHATGELENTGRVVAVRRDVARLLTVAKERGIDLERELRV